MMHRRPSSRNRLHSHPLPARTSFPFTPVQSTTTLLALVLPLVSREPELSRTPLTAAAPLVHPQSAARALEALNGRDFDGNTVKATFLPAGSI